MYKQAMWECYWMTFHGQSRLTTFRKLIKLGLSPRVAVEMIQNCEREG